MENQVSMINKTVKKEFIRWFLKTYTMKRRETVWILNYLISHDELLNNIVFVDNAHEYKRGMVMSAKDSEEIPFRFYRGELMSVDAEMAFHNMRLHKDEPMYIQLNFPSKHTEHRYLDVLEDHNRSEKISPDIIEAAESVITELEKINILKAIVVTLDSGDEKLFAELCEMLNEVGQKKKTLSFSG